MSATTSLESTYILGMKVNHTSYLEAAETICAWAQEGQSRYVCVAAVNQIMEAHDSPDFLRVMNEADMVTPDGMPLVWGLKLLGHPDATRVYGPDLTPVVLKMAEARGLKVGFYGGSPHALDRLIQRLSELFPRLRITYSYSPPFRALTPEEDAAVVDAINLSGTNVLFLGLSSPKQDIWMAAHRKRLSAVMIGVGAAFDFLSGSKPQAPRWMMRLGLEWLFRLMTEPRRLWKRYLKHNPRFLVLFAKQLYSERRMR